METKKQPEMSCLEFLSMTDPTWGVQSRSLVPAFKPGDPTMLGAATPSVLACPLAAALFLH